MILFIISFIAGILTVLAPCILPLLPVIVGGSVNDPKAGKKKAFVVTLSLAVSVIIFTLLLKVTAIFVDVPDYVWKYISGGIILIIGLITIFPSIWENKYTAKLSSKSNQLLGVGNRRKGFLGDVIVGASLGPVFTTCSPTYFIVLATVLPANPIVGITYMLAYVVGLSLALFGISIVGQKILHRLSIVANPNGWFKKILGIIFVLVAMAILFGIDKKIETKILNSGFFDVTKIEHKLLELQDGSGKVSSSGEYKKFKAPELVNPDGFINTGGESITLAQYAGDKIVLLDVWTYSCINCQRTIPYLNAWYDKYHKYGLEIIGLHTPEFAFEKLQENVEDAVAGFGIKYPVVLDNEYKTWNAYGNRYWPRKYIINLDGDVVYDHIGEGSYDETEKKIQELLIDRAERLGIEVDFDTNLVDPEGILKSEANSPETYFGYSRNKNLANGQPGASGYQNFELPSVILPNLLYLKGSWDIQKEYAQSVKDSEVLFRYDAKDVYMVASSDAPIEIEIFNDDVLVNKVTVSSEKLYTLIENSSAKKGVLRIEIPAGLKAFTFTFG